MDDHGEGTAYPGEGSRSVEREVVGLFEEHPYLLVSEGRLAVLLCRPLDMVVEAVRALEDSGFLRRRDEETLICTMCMAEQAPEPAY